METTSDPKHFRQGTLNLYNLRTGFNGKHDSGYTES